MGKKVKSKPSLKPSKAEIKGSLQPDLTELKAEAKRLLQAENSIDHTIGVTGLPRAVVLGIHGAMVKKAKKTELIYADKLKERSPEALHLLLEGRPPSEVEEATGLRKKDVLQLYQGMLTELKGEQEPQTEPSNITQADGEGGRLSPPVDFAPQGNVNPSPSPQNQGVIIDVDDPDFERLLRDLQEGVGALVPTKAKIWKTILSNWKLEKRMTQRARSAQGANGHGGIYHDRISTREMLDRLQLQQMIDKMGGSQQQNQVGFKEFLQMMQLAQQMSGGKTSQPDSLGTYRVGRKDASEEFAKLQQASKAGSTNEMDYRISLSNQSHDLDMKKLQWEMQKYDRKEQGQGQTLEAIKGIFQGPVGEAIKAFGNAGADRVRGNKNPQNPQIVKAMCPACGGTFDANPSLNTIACPLCGVTLSKGGPQAQEPKPVIREIPQKSTKKTKSKDVEVNEKND